MSETEISRVSKMEESVSTATQVMKALSNQTRLMLMCAMIDGEKSVNQLASLVDMQLPAVSQHLAKLRANGLVTARRDAQTLYYRASEGVAQNVVNTLCSYYSTDPTDKAQAPRDS